MSTNPFFNLAAEEWFFNHMPADQHLLFLWHNSPCVVIGKHQNPWAECRLDQMKEDGVELIRRRSGGGAVYQDLGNTNFTFISPRREFSKEMNSKMITNMLKSNFGIEAETSGRNDILVDGHKVSGSAYKLSHTTAMHHGTLLLDVDTQALEKYLSPNVLKLKSKGVASVSARVTNLSTLNNRIHHDSIVEALYREFTETYAEDCEMEPFREESMASDAALQQGINAIKDWNWRFGVSPQFSNFVENKWDWGLMSVHLEVKNGAIADVAIFSDTLFPSLVETLQKELKGAALSEAGINSAMDRARNVLTQEIEKEKKNNNNSGLKKNDVNSVSVPPLASYVEDVRVWMLKTVL